MKTACTYINLSGPCHENWEAMTAVDKGRYCAACSKTVIDYSLLSDGAILDMLSRTSGQGACGRFSAEQLNRPLVDTRYKPSFAGYVAKRAAAVLLLFQTIVTTAVAQQAKGNKKTEQRHKARKPAVDIRQIRGRVLDYGVTPVSGIKVHISIAGIADTVTDAKGVFIFNLPVGLHDSAITLQVKPASDTFIIDDEIITPADIANGTEVILYRYRQARLPETKIVQAGKPLTDVYKGGFSVRVDKDSKGINSSDVKTPRLHSYQSFWQSIVQPFKRKKHVGQ